MIGTFDKMISEWVRGNIKLGEALKEFERKYITVALREHGGNRSVVARKLGIHRNTLTNKVKSLNL